MTRITHLAKGGITRFFEEILGAKLKSSYWSWGAKDPDTNRIYLRVWEDQISNDADGEKVQVYWHRHRNKSPGYKERLQHLAEIQNGYKIIGILCKAEDLNPIGKRKINGYDDTQLLLLGDLSEDTDYKYARIVKNLPVHELPNLDVIADIEKFCSNTANPTDPTTVQALVTARVGQGKFGWGVRQFWGHQCSVTGASTKATLEASHIKSWANSNNGERLDPQNGLLLTANLHKLFDAGLISFEDSGEMLVSSELSANEQRIFDVVGKRLRQKPSSAMANYLAQHREKFRK